jgi:hypothetical protein
MAKATTSRKSGRMGGFCRRMRALVCGAGQRRGRALNAVINGDVKCRTILLNPLGIFVLPLVKAHGSVAAVLIMMAIVSGLGAAATAILAREVGEIPEGRSIDEAEAP